MQKEGELSSKKGADLGLWCGVAGSWMGLYEPQHEQDVVNFVEKCAKVGVTKLLCAYYTAPVRSHRWVFRLPGVEAPYERYGYGEKSALNVLVKHAHGHGIEVHPYVAVGHQGWWRPHPESALREFLPILHLSKFASDHPAYFTKTREGKSWLDIDRRQRLTGYPGVGLLSLAYPEVREYFTSLCVEFVQDYGVDGVQLEFIIPPTDEQGFCLLGYDEPAMTAFRVEYGQDPREIDNSDENWMRFRAGYATQFIRELKEVLSNLEADVELSLQTEATGSTFSEPANAYKVMFDWPTWVEEQLFDVLYPRFWLSNPAWWSIAPTDIAAELSSIKRQVGDRCRVVTGLAIVGGREDIGWSEDIARLVEREAMAALEAGVDGVAIHRSEFVEGLGLWGMLANIGSSEHVKV
jgi:hypothetical protein